MAFKLYVTRTAVRTGQLDRSCRIRDTQTGAYELFHPRLMRAEFQELLKRALELVRQHPDDWPARLSFRGEPRAYVVAAETLSETKTKMAERSASDSASTP